MTTTIHRGTAAALCLGLLAACTATKLETKAALPPPLIEKLPVRVGVYYSKEFREYVHRETRGSIDYEVTLCAAHVTNLVWLLGAMFRDLVQVDDPTRIANIQPPLVMVLEPKFEEYSFLTPKDVAGEAFIVEAFKAQFRAGDQTGYAIDPTAVDQDEVGDAASHKTLATE